VWEFGRPTDVWHATGSSAGLARGCLDAARQEWRQSAASPIFGAGRSRQSARVS
jgi:hypothetical protein